MSKQTRDIINELYYIIATVPMVEANRNRVQDAINEITRLATINEVNRPRAALESDD